MISPPLPHSPKMPPLNCCGRDREGFAVSLPLNHDFFPLHMLAQLSIPEWADLPAPVSLGENAANAPVFSLSAAH